MNIQLLKVAKFYRRLYGGGRKGKLPPPPSPPSTYNVCKFSQLSGAIFSLANFKELLSLVSTDFP